MNFNQIIDRLKQRRLVFHSEDDLKLAMAMIIKENYPLYEIRLERPIQINMIGKDSNTIIARAPIDIVVIDRASEIVYPIEIKYKSKLAKLYHNKEFYDLSNQEANDVGRYSFRKDIYRIENVDLEYIGFNEFTKKGFVFILTNDRKYYLNDVSTKNSLDANFSFHHGVILKAEYFGWNYKKLPENKYYFDDTPPLGKSLKKHWTSGKEYIYQLGLKRDYLIQWKDYSNLNDKDGLVVDFKYCLIEIDV